MILVDIGNSGLRACRVDNGQLFRDQKVYRLSWVAATANLRKPSPEQEAAPDQRWCKLEDRSAFNWLVSQFDSFPNETWLVSCVQRIALDQLRESLCSCGHNTELQVVTHSQIPMTIDVELPTRTGVDRLLAAYTAHRFVNHSQNVDKNGTELQAVVVIQAGTAVTVDLVDAGGVFRGGSIMPGLGLSLQLLAAGTDLLPWLGNHAVDALPALPGKNTEQAISAGVNAALVGGASHLVERYRSESKHGKTLKVIVSGGDGRLLMPHIPQPAEFVNHVVLHGLSLIGTDRYHR
jgi:type III pantothenate kinase